MPGAPPASADPDRGRAADPAIAAGRMRALLEAAADPSGFLPFDQFMGLALYAPEVGFYDRRASPFGPEGDFYTSAHVHPVFGASIAAHLKAVRRTLEPGRPFRLVELGPGDGTLARSILTALGPSPEGSGPLEYVLVDHSPRRAATAFERAEPAARAAGAALTLSASVGADGPFEGAVIANEVLDAQPCRRLRWAEGRWRELGIRLVEGRPVPAEGELTRPVPPPALPKTPEEGLVFECSPGAESLVREVADHLTAGAVLLLDYGMEEDELVRGHPEGTLTALREHRTVPDPYEDPGASDLSAFVNFSRIRAAAARAGLEEVAYCSQTEALATWGISDLIAAEVARARSSEEEVRTRLAAKSLLFGFERFRLLELAPPASARAIRGVT